MSEPFLLLPGPNPTIRRAEDGTLCAEDRFPDVLAISRELLDPALLVLPGGVVEPMRPWDAGIHRRGDIVEIKLSNGRWIYRIAEWRDDGATAICTIQYREDV